MGKIIVPILVILVGFVVFGVWNNSSEVKVSTVDENHSTEPPSGESMKEPSPVPVPTPTPSPSQPDYFTYRSQMNIMEPDDVDIYFERLKEKPVTHWIGVIKEKLFLNDGYDGMTIEMDENPAVRPDVVLTKIDKSVLEKYQPGQRIRFSGVIAGHINVDNMPRIMAIKDVVIYE